MTIEPLEPAADRMRRATMIPYSVRQTHVPRHGVQPKAHFGRWAASAMRELGHRLVGDFRKP